MSGENTGRTGKTYMMSMSSWPVERWVAAIVVGALTLLILIKMGFREINILGVKAGV